MLWMKFEDLETNSPIWINMEKAWTLKDKWATEDELPAGCVVTWGIGHTLVRGDADSIVHWCEEAELAQRRKLNEAPQDEAS